MDTCAWNKPNVELVYIAPSSVFKWYYCWLYNMANASSLATVQNKKATVIIPAGLRDFGLGALIKADSTLVVWISRQLLFLSELGGMLVLKTSLVKGKHNDKGKDFTATL